jgi:hypothetical protein
MIAVTGLTAPDGTPIAVREARDVVVSPGTDTTVRVVNYADDAPGRVEIRWDGSEGPLLGEADGLSVPVRIPAATSGVHNLTALFRGTDGKVLSKASAPVTVGDRGVGVQSSAWQQSASTGTSRSGSPATAGVALLAVGSVMAFAGVAWATTRRRSTARS